MTTPVTTNPAILQKLEALASERDRLAQQLCQPEVLADHTKIRELSIRKAELDPIADEYHRYLKLRQESDNLRTLLSQADADPELAELARAELPEVERSAEETIEKVLESLVNSQDRSIGSIMLELRAGVGGDEAGLWAADLLEMYKSFAAGRRWSFEPMSLDFDEGMGGLRSAVVNIRGPGVWAELMNEAGAHCVKRVPATETQGRVHTSTATVAVLPEPETVEIELNPDDVDEHITTAQGPGGQNVNKVATAVHLIHRPTGLEVRMQETKSQQQNREKAWRLLRARLYERELERRRREEAAARSEQIGSGGRAERIRTYRYKDGIAVDHRLNESFPLAATLAGELGRITGPLQKQETARRLAAW